MTVFVIAELTITDRARYGEYEAGFMEIFARHGGALLAVDEAPKAIEGTWSATRIVIVSFPDEPAFRAWFDSPAYQALASHRHAASHGSILLVRGLPSASIPKA